MSLRQGGLLPLNWFLYWNGKRTLGSFLLSLLYPLVHFEVFLVQSVEVLLCLCPVRIVCDLFSGGYSSCWHWPVGGPELRFLYPIVHLNVFVVDFVKIVLSS